MIWASKFDKKIDIFWIATLIIEYHDWQGDIFGQTPVIKYLIEYHLLCLLTQIYNYLIFCELII